MAVDKGAIDDGHVLVLPIEHFPNSLGVPASTYAEMDRYLSALRSCYAAQASASTHLIGTAQSPFLRACPTDVMMTNC